MSANFARCLSVDSFSIIVGQLRIIEIARKAATRRETKPIEKYAPILEMISRNYENLERVLLVKPEKCLKRYTINGLKIVKSVQMVNSLNQMVVEYSRVNNISQREIFEVALIEFFMKYGFKKEVEQIFGF